MNKKIKLFLKTFHKKLFYLVCLFVLLFQFFFMYKYYQRIGAFGCADQCHIFTSAYFLLRGKILYSEIFFNHQPLMPFISYGIQRVIHPQTLYSLILSHHIFIMFFSFIMSVILIIRFKWRGIGFVLIYESTKYYLHGNLFLPEALVVYPLVYLFGIILNSLNGKKPYPWEFVFACFLSWIVIFAREPYAPTALFLYIFILISNKKKYIKQKIFSVVIFIILTFFIFLLFPFNDYLRDVFVVNNQESLRNGDAANLKEIHTWLKIFLYPIFIFFEGKWTNIRMELICLTSLFFIGLLHLLKTKKVSSVPLILFILGTANIRIVPPGTTFYEAFHMIPWYGMFIMVTISLFWDYLISKRKLAKIILGIFVILSMYSIFSSSSFIWDNIDRYTEFNVNYAPYYSTGSVVALLSDKKDTLFLDEWDDLIYWQAGIGSSYPYSLYIPIMTVLEQFRKERLVMFQTNPPDFYYAWCADNEFVTSLPDFAKDSYTQLYKNGKPSCLFIKKAKVDHISKEKWELVKSFGFIR